MILTKDEILKHIKKGKIIITPFNERNVGPGSIDLTLDEEFRVFKKMGRRITLVEHYDYKKISTVKKGAIVLPPGAFVHGITKERVKIPENICGLLTGRSNFARMGILIHATASFIQPGVNNRQVLEIKNISSNTIVLEPGLKICQLVLMQAKGKARYDNKYKNQFEV